MKKELASCKKCLFQLPLHKTLKDTPKKTTKWAYIFLLALLVLTRYKYQIPQQSKSTKAVTQTYNWPAIYFNILQNRHFSLCFFLGPVLFILECAKI